MDKIECRLRNFRLILLAVIICVIIYFISADVTMSWNIFLAMMGFSAVVFIHECGHFFVAKASNIKVEVFSIFLPPILFGIRRTEAGWRVRILPKYFPKEGDEDGDGMLSFTFGKAGKAGETEYRLGLIPLAGYVKMLGQEDIGADKQCDDSRSFGNKSVKVRMAVIAAGVIFNVIAAIGIMSGVYLYGINRMPAVVGGVRAGTPAERAGLRAGDEIIEIGGKDGRLDFSDIMVAAALSDVNEPVAIKVRHEDGMVEDYEIVAEQMMGMPVRLFGIEPPMSLTIAKVAAADANELFAKTGLKAGDRVISVNGREVKTYWALEELLEGSFVPSVTVVAERLKESGEVELVESQIGMELLHAAGKVEEESDLGHIYSMVPRLRITVVDNPAKPIRAGDIIIKVGNIENPTYKELRDVTEAHEDKEMAMKVLRTGEDGVDREIPVVVVPKRPAGLDKVMIGIGVVLDAEHAVVAKTIQTEGAPEQLDIPRGALITAIDGVRVSNFYDCIKELKNNDGHHVTIEYVVGEQVKGGVGVDVNMSEGSITVNRVLAESIPFASLEREYKAKGIFNAIAMGSQKSVEFIIQTYVTLKGLFAGNIGMDAMSGPVGIATMTYKAVEYSFVSFLYLLAFISANLAVINFLPIPVVDGGVFVLLIVEKIKGSPVSVRIQEIITYAGLAFLGAVFIYFTYNDIMRLATGWYR